MFYSSLPYCFNGAVFAAVDRYVRLSARLVLNLNAIMIVIPSADKLQKHHLYGSPQPCQHSRNPLYNPCTLDLPWMSLMQVINTMLHTNLSLTLNSVTKRNVVGTSQVQNGPVFLSFWGHFKHKHSHSVLHFMYFLFFILYYEIASYVDEFPFRTGSQGESVSKDLIESTSHRAS